MAKVSQDLLLKRAEDEFLQGIYAYLGDHMGKESFNVPALCKHLGLSRTNLAN